MRSDYNILWLDDDFDDDTTVLRKLVNQVEFYLKEKGYIPNIIKVSNKNSALTEINSNRKIDLFLSDYNIGSDDEFSGFDFLIATRKSYKQEMLLYSNQDSEHIKSHLLIYLSKDSTPLEYFSKFIFQSALDIPLLLNSIKSIIDLTLLKWNELNALRGLYLSETSQIHSNAKEYIAKNVPNSNLYTNFQKNYQLNKKNRKSDILSILNGTDTDLQKIDYFDFNEVQCILSSDINDLYFKWDVIREIRNGCAHVVQLRDINGENFIESLGKSKMKIMESEIDRYRVRLQLFIELYYNSFPLDTENIEEKTVTPTVQT